MSVTHNKKIYVWKPNEQHQLMAIWSMGILQLEKVNL